jgi:hypothetical protein
MVAAPTPSAEAIAEFKRNSDLTFDALVAERGGIATLTVADCGILRKLAKLLASPSADPRVADAIARLTDLVPPALSQPIKPQPTLTVEDLERDLPWDLAKLNDVQFALLEELHALATGRAMPVPNRRLEAALALVRAVGELECDGGVPSDEAINLLRGDVQGLLWPVCTLAWFLEPYAPSEKTRVDSAPYVPPSESPPELVPGRASNVVRMPPRDASWAG